MMKSLLKKEISDPFRWLFPLGIIFVIAGASVWVPLLWNPDLYPVLTHQYLMISGFVSCFVAGFLMTAIPRFSQTQFASGLEVGLFILITFIGLTCALQGNETGMYVMSGSQAIILLSFIFRRIYYRKVNPPYSFLFIFLGLALWIFSDIHRALTGLEDYKNLHYEAAILAIILGVGGRLIPGILGHVEVVQVQRSRYEQNISLLKTVPSYFFVLIMLWPLAYVLNLFWVKLVVILILLYGWKIHHFPKERSSLTWSIWIAAWLTFVGFVLTGVMNEGEIHHLHGVFIGGVTLITLLVATRVIQSHGPKDKALENKRILFFITGLMVLAMSTRVSAFYMPESYLHHLSYSAIILVLGVLIWSWRYLRYVRSTSA